MEAPNSEDRNNSYFSEGLIGTRSLYSFLVITVSIL